MPIPFVAVGGKITAALINSLINGVNAQGTFKVKPIPTATGGTATVSSLGRVTFMNVNSLQLASAFLTSAPQAEAFDVYINITACSAGTYITGQIGTAVAVSSANYDNQYVYSIATTGTTQSNTTTAAQTSWTLSAGGGSVAKKIKLRLESPNLVAPTTVDIVASEYGAASVPTRLVGTLGMRVSTAYSDLFIASSTGTISGTVDIVGYNNG